MIENFKFVTECIDEGIVDFKVLAGKPYEVCNHNFLVYCVEIQNCERQVNYCKSTNFRTHLIYGNKTKFKIT